jgi:dynein heavy chain, axonemal
LIENIQLEPKWVEHVEQCLQQMQERQECSDKFRLWLSMPQRETTSDILIKACVKVAL